VPNPLIKGFSNAGRKFVGQLHKLLPAVVFGSTSEANRARYQLEQAAEQASREMKVASAIWLKGKPMAKAAAIGGKRVAAEIGVKFGGVSQTLTKQLALDLARNLAVASSSPNAFLTRTLREATAIGVKAEDSWRKLVDPNSAMTRSLLKSAVGQQVYAKAVSSMMEDLGLDKGDRVLFMSGYRMEAEAYAKLVVRTRTMEALNEGKADQLEQAGVEYIETTQHEDVDEKDICFFLQGKVWALGENDLGIPVLPEEYGLPPWHPNCRHTFGAWQPKFEDQKTVDKAVESHADDEEKLADWDGKVYQPASKSDD